MKTNAVELRVLKMRLLKPFRTSFGVQQDRYPLLVRLEIDGRSQWGECVAGEGPWYSYETVETAWQVLKGYLLPAVIGRDLQNVDALETLFAPVRGHHMAKACIEMALTAALAEHARKPLAKFLGGVRDRVEPGGSFGLLMLEQPLAAGDLVDHAALQRQMRTPICLDESIESARDARQALQLGACQVINIKPGRVGGFAESRRIHDIAANAGVPVWCGGMLETGIGRACNVALATLPNFRLPGDISASDRYWAEDIVEPPFTLQRGGTVSVPTRWGLGVRVKVDLVERLTV